MPADRAARRRPATRLIQKRRGDDAARRRQAVPLVHAVVAELLVEALLLLLDLLLDVGIEVDRERQEDLHVADEEARAVKGEKDVELALVPVHLEEGLHVLEDGDLRAHSAGREFWVTIFFEECLLRNLLLNWSDD